MNVCLLAVAEMRLAEMQRMGAGSKPCIDLKPSKNNIHDRFVNRSENDYKSLEST